MIADEKLIKYLLSSALSKGTDKAKLFSLFGYTTANAAILKIQLNKIAFEREVESISENDYGIFILCRMKLKRHQGKYYCSKLFGMCLMELRRRGL